ncbi:pentatricopeptide repeat-containing protein At2g36980, mitochondrial-like [Papaver somniferum]|uniref:pentatricopeptide repeat-containing protein At2g36980, mitochondrial-like n=1 Tax=Papaver somniferum TaxID=3469 RepID=UPI000E6FEA30|nr:pentatricopeptide repeat-containing protein At2g36980, mitochondrial-like [Papaver somniferum]
MFQVTSKIVALAKSGKITLARKLFDEMQHRDTIAWNAMLTSYSKSGLYQDALSLFSEMRFSDTPLDDFTITSALSACADLGDFYHGSKIHGLVVRSGFQSSLPVCNCLIHMYGKCLVPLNACRMFEEITCQNDVSWCSLLFAYVKSGELDRGQWVFDNMPNHVEFAWNILIAGYSRTGKFELCLQLFRNMRKTASKPDLWTFTALMNACAELPNSYYGRMIHGCIAKTRWISEVEVNNSILSFYAKVGCCEDAVKIFESIESHTQVSWNAMIDAHIKVGDVHEALAVFHQALEKNLVSWTTMITGYAKSGYVEKALSFLVDMTRNLLRPDEFTFGAVLHGCSNLAFEGPGKVIHGCIIRYGFCSHAYVGNSLVNMYAKCGDIDGSTRAFSDIIDKDLVTWNTMLLGLGLHGRVIEALRFYEEMLESRMMPDKVTFIGMLMTCSHSGFIEKGKAIFESMESIYGVAHEADHVACMVDLLGRGGYLQQAKELVEEHSHKLQTSSNETLLGACATHGQMGLGVSLGEDLRSLKPEREIGYVLLSNLYCANGLWKEAEKIRKIMLERGVKKSPGCSWIEMKNEVMVFVAGNESKNHEMNEMYQMLRVLESDMRNPSYFCI